MATYTDNYQLTKPTYAEQADIGVVNSNMNKIDEVMHSSQISLAPAYDQSQTYAEGDVVMYELLMYKCISPTTGVWDGSKWERTTASESGGGGSAELDILGEGNGAVVSFADGASAGLAKCIAEIVPKQAGSGTPSPDNVRAISGYTAVKVDVAGKNLLDNTLCIGRTIYGIQRIVNNDGTITITGTSTTVSQWWNSADNLGVFFKKGTYTISCNGVELQALFRKARAVSGTFTLSEDDYLDNVQFRTTVGETYNLKTEPMIRLATESDTFEPYKGSTTTIPLGQTVYGGQLNVLTGELTIDRQIVDLGSLTWTRTDNSIIDVGYWFHANISDKMATGETINSNYRTAPYKSVTQLVNAEGSAVDKVAVEAGGEVGYRIIDSSYTDATAFKTAMNGVQMCYFLATPQTVQLTPQEVNSILGQNNISADTGDVDIVYVKASAPIQPNPTGTPTATLKKLGIEGTVFELEGGGGGSSGGINYSTTERVVGTWIDGKPLYAKTIEVYNLVSGNNTVSHGIANLKMTVENISFLIDNNNYTNQLPAISTVSGWSARARDFGLTTFVIELGSEIARYYTDAIVTMFYTKITD